MNVVLKPLTSVIIQWSLKSMFSISPSLLQTLLNFIYEGTQSSCHVLPRMLSIICPLLCPVFLPRGNYRSLSASCKTQPSLGMMWTTDSANPDPSDLDIGQKPACILLCLLNFTAVCTYTVKLQTQASKIRGLSKTLALVLDTELSAFFCTFWYNKIY